MFKIVDQTKKRTQTQNLYEQKNKRGVIKIRF